MKNNYMQAGRIVECGHCNPKDFGEGLKLGEKMGLKCYCICHDECTHDLDSLCDECDMTSNMKKEAMMDEAIASAELASETTPFEKETIEMFDKKFSKINHIHHGECAITDITGTKFEAHTDENGLVTEIGGLESIKDFLLYRLHALSALYRKEIVEALEKLHEHEIKGLKINRNDVATIPDRYAKGYNNAVEDAKKLLEKITKHENNLPQQNSKRNRR